MNKVSEVYKGTDKDMKCHGGYQYEISKKEIDTGAIRCGDKGFHSCEAPFDVLRYFPLRDGNRYFTAEASGIIDRTNAQDSKIASSELTIKSEIGIAGLIKAQIAYTKRKAESGKNAVIVLTEWGWRNDKYMPVSVKAEIVDGERIKADTWYELKDGEFRESEVE